MTPGPDSPRSDYCFHGAFERSVDAKGRFNLPFRFRQGGGAPEDESYVIAPGADGNLAVFPQAQWDHTFHLMKSRMSSADWRKTVREFSGMSYRISPDTQGRVTVPLGLLKKAGITRRVKVVGMGTSMELWDPDRYDEIHDGSGELDPEFLNAFFQ